VPMAPGSGNGIIGAINGFYGGYKDRIDDAVKRVLRVKFWMNLFSPEQYITNRALTAVVGSAEHRDVARACVRASLVLLKKENAALPIPKNAKVEIWGEAGNNYSLTCGGWTVGWQGGNTPGGTTIKDGMTAVGTGGTVTHVGSPAGAGSADYIVAVLSENGYAETTIPSISLTNEKATGSNGAVINQLAAAKAANKKVIVILVAGRPLDVSPIIGKCDALIWASLPGTEGKGIAEMLYGDYKFTGKLPVTWPKDGNDEPINKGDGKTGLFAYGFGITD
jgi:beta-glucosidase